ncbi:hypothetical protein CLV63_1261 [Murinocardiopsis flavida]|uniref:DUF6879 domain-containing protein n=1 Tax=Murinocardiopsis flavida TaxID=645275 RepID=A0A2P8CWM8_9ACTN|nr:DUF6879 family protein [Murinocardiopsis flavida]PSK89365.1 hypothetical protein CLV63_1261 [Murinocardiopsis flavida]
MRDPHAPDLPVEQGEALERMVYKREFRERDAAIRDRDSWKFERRQDFTEKDNPSWDAFVRGDWETSLRLIEDDREAVLRANEQDALHRSFFHRARIVEKPLTPYVQWSLHSFRMQAECGQRIRIVGADALAASDRDSVLPEVVVLGGRTLYRVLYDEVGAPYGAVRYTDPEIIGNWEDYIRGLYEVGEDVRTFFDREVAHLPPPTVAAE